MKNLIQLPAEIDYNLLLHVLRGYKKPRDKIMDFGQDPDLALTAVRNALGINPNLLESRRQNLDTEMDQILGRIAEM